MRKLLVTAMAILTLTGCSLLGPRPGRIAQWLTIPTPGALYTYFKSKDAMFWTLMENIGDRFLAMLSEPIDEALPFEERFRIFFFV